MKLLFFKLKLIFFLALFLFDVLFDRVKRAKKIFVLIIFSLLIINFIFFYLIKSHLNVEKELLNTSFSPTRPELYSVSKMTKEEILIRISYWEKVLEKQPNSRDVLINLSMLKKALQLDDEAEILWEKARNTDPNNPIFKQN